jgi:putative DNA primase/helicase
MIPKLEYKVGTKIELLNKVDKVQSHIYVQFWSWLDEKKNLVGYIGRKKDKRTHQIFWTDKGWTQGSLGDNKPMFGSETLGLPDPVYVVEGEKTWQAASDRLQHPVITWVGGAKAVKKTDYSGLKGRKIILCPDNDQPGLEAMNYLTNLLVDHCDIEIMEIPDEMPEHWDIADWEVKDLKESIAKYLKPIEKEKKKLSNTEFLLDYINPLGFDDQKIYLMTKTQSVISSLKRFNLSKSDLIGLLSLSLWKQVFPSNHQDGVNWTEACDWVLRVCEKKGHFSTEQIRGLGVWRESNNSFVLHLGNKLIVDGSELKIHDQDFVNIYPLRNSQASWSRANLSAKDASLIKDLALAFNWENEIYGPLLLGWLVCALVSGSLKWRPHIWITGPYGCGKSTVLNDFVVKLLGRWCLYVEGNTTEAGIRQSLKSDSLPVIFDESESNEKNNSKSIQDLLGLMRISSTNSCAKVLRGTVNHNSVEFNIGSCFCLGSITVGLKQEADKSRVALLELKKNQDQVKWSSIIQPLLSKIDDNLSKKLFSTVINNLPEFHANIELLSTVLTRKVGSARLGDQYGTLIAGFAIIDGLSKNKSDLKLTESQAKDILNEYNWAFLSLNQANDQELKLLNTIQSLIVSVSRVNSSPTRITIQELIESVTKINHSPHKPVFCEENEARAALRRYGILITNGGDIILANDNDELRFALDGKFNSPNWNQLLKRLPDAKSSSPRKLDDKSIKGLEIPISYFKDTTFTT